MPWAGRRSPWSSAWPHGQSRSRMVGSSPRGCWSHLVSGRKKPGTPYLAKQILCLGNKQLVFFWLLDVPGCAIEGPSSGQDGL